MCINVTVVARRIYKKDQTMRKLFTILFLMITLVAQAQRQQISYIEETKNWYYVYDEKGKRIGGQLDLHME